MKRTLATFFAALALFLTALWVPGDPRDDTLFLPLDLTGVEIIEIQSVREVTVELDALLAPGVSYPIETGRGISARRDGERLVLASTIQGYAPVTVNLPPTVHRLVVENAEIHARQPVDSMMLEVRGRLYWIGDARQLDVDHRGKAPSRPSRGNERFAAYAFCDTQCDGWMTIGPGRIGRLVASSARGHMLLEHSDDIDSAFLHLGADATFSIGNATRLPNLVLEPLDSPAAPPADSETPTP
ncbi:MAG TPA: hypothetical protein VFQ84_04915 [Arenimonas sp.]|uniref:hypothetical protein n=1 Tax=Arenimonas sp. TaxID=1872635 RepID=UPI002D7FCF35|nr:hypothetical protein [Arenimonas sp.]HEU0152668.1 hypothetical protein [Arenimonas sp.]